MGETVKDTAERGRTSAGAEAPGLVIVWSGGLPRFEVLSLRKGQLSLGRDALRARGLPDERVSQVHLAVRWDGSVWTVTDEGSTNPFRHMEARLLLGRALEEQDDRAGGCAEYGRVIERWGRALPRSVSADAAKERWAALGCKGGH